MSLPATVIRSAFIGRDDDLANLEAQVLEPSTRLLTVTGPGGVGKTRLAAELAQRVAAAFPGGVWLVPLARIHQPDLVIGSIAAELEIRDIDAGETLERVAERLNGPPALLIVDTLEHVVECGPLLALLLQRSPNLSILATSRQPLQLQGETEFPLRPLRTDSDSATESPAETLFLLRAREASYGFVATQENRLAIRQISERLGGIPLAIELAASWVKILPPQKLLENLDRQLDVLVRGPRDLPERQQTMRSAIAWSYQLLSECEQRLFRQIGVFHGGFSLADVEALAGGSELGAWSELDTLEALSSLVTKSLVQASDNPIDPEQPEYTVLEIIRDYAMEQLQQAGEATQTRDRHLAYFVPLTERWTVDLGSPQRDRRLSQLDREYPNFRAALEWAHQTRNAEMGMRLISALWVYWDWRGFHAEGARWCERILAMDVPVDLDIQSSALYAAAAIAFMQANYPRTLTLAEECLSVAEASGADRTIGRALIALGNAAYDQGDLERAETVYARSLDKIRRIDESTALQVALVNLGFVRYQQERYDEARALFDEALAEELHTGRSAGLNWALVGLAQVDVRSGNIAAADERLVRLVDQQRETDSGQLGAALAVLAAVRRTQGRYGEADALARESLANRVAREERAFVTDSLAEVGAIALTAGAFEDGVVLSSAVAAQRDRLGYGLPDRERIRHRELFDHARATMSPAAFENARRIGQRMTISEAIAYAGTHPYSDARAPVPPPQPAAHTSVLTRREQEVLQLIVEGCTDREIANRLSISSGTASRHVANILHKLDVRTRSAAAAWAVRNGAS